MRRYRQWVGWAIAASTALWAGGCPTEPPACPRPAPTAPIEPGTYRGTQECRVEVRLAGRPVELPVETRQSFPFELTIEPGRRVIILGRAMESGTIFEIDLGGGAVLRQQVDEVVTEPTLIRATYTVTLLLPDPGVELVGTGSWEITARDGTTIDFVEDGAMELPSASGLFTASLCCQAPLTR